MRKLLLILPIIFGLAYLCACSSKNENENKSNDVVRKYTVDDLLRDFPELVPETVWVDVRLPKVELDNEIVNSIMAVDLAAKLRKYRPQSKIIVSLQSYPFCHFDAERNYVFRPVTPIEPTSLNVKGNRLRDIIAYLQYDDIYVLLTDSFKNQIVYSDTILHDFKLKLVKQSKDETCYWQYFVNDSIVKRPPNPADIYYDWWEPKIIKMFDAMDQHDF